MRARNWGPGGSQRTFGNSKEEIMVQLDKHHAFETESNDEISLRRGMRVNIRQCCKVLYILLSTRASVPLSVTLSGEGVFAAINTNSLEVLSILLKFSLMCA